MRVHACVPAAPRRRLLPRGAGQALCALGQYEGAARDLRAALALSPDAEKGVIQEKLAEAEQKLKHASRGGWVDGH